MRKAAIWSGLTLLMGVLAAGLVAVTLPAQGQAQEAQEEPSPYEETKDLYEETKHLVGRELADALGLDAIEVDPKARLVPGEGPLSGCPPVPGWPGFVVEVAEGVVYCTPAGLDEFEASDVAQRLRVSDENQVS